VGADDRTETAKFWEQVRWYLPPYLRDKRVLLTEARSPDHLEISTVWWNGNTEYIGSLRRTAGEEGEIQLLLGKPGCGPEPRAVARSIETEALRQVIDNLPGDDVGALRIGDEGIMWDEVPIASFTDMTLKREDVEKGLGAFVEYATDRLERSLLREITLNTLDLVMRDGVDIATARILSPRLAAIDAPKGRLIIHVDGGMGRVTRLGIEVDPYVTAEIASYGVHYSSLMDYHKTIDEVTGR
jgi:hypothetical protein